MRAREFIVEYDRKKTAQAISGSERAERAIIADRGDMGPLGHVRSSLIGLQMGSRPITIPGAQPAFTPSSNHRENSGPLIKDPQTRARFLEDLLSVIETKDPTTNKQYTPWLARMYINGGVKLEDLNRNNILGIYDIGKRRRMIKPEDNDINRFKTYKEFESTMLNKSELDAMDNTEKKAEEKGQATKVFENGDVLVVVPHDQAAACRYGANTRWCTAATQGQNYFDSYNRQGKMYILIPKQPQHEGEKYQLHFPSSQFMNEDDIPVAITFIFDRFPELKEFFFENEPEIKNLIDFVPDDVLQPLIDKIAELVDEQIWEIISEWEMNDDYYLDQMREKYADEDGDIDWDKVDAGNDTYLQWNDEVRRFEIDMNHAVKISASKLKKWVAAEWEGHEGEDRTLTALPEIMAERVRAEFPGKNDYDGNIPEFLNRKVIVTNNGDGWEVSIVKPLKPRPRP